MSLDWIKTLIPLLIVCYIIIFFIIRSNIQRDEEMVVELKKYLYRMGYYMGDINSPEIDSWLVKTLNALDHKHYEELIDVFDRDFIDFIKRY